MFLSSENSYAEALTPPPKVMVFEDRALGDTVR